MLNLSQYLIAVWLNTIPVGFNSEPHQEIMLTSLFLDFISFFIIIIFIKNFSSLKDKFKANERREREEKRKKGEKQKEMIEMIEKERNFKKFPTNIYNLIFCLPSRMHLFQHSLSKLTFELLPLIFFQIGFTRFEIFCGGHWSFMWKSPW